ncbi:F-box protein [Raphanus sativus]|nr:F-box protein [Raphanus sativus]
MGAVRLTCKEWDALSKSRSFSKMHIGKLSAADESMIVVLMDYNLYLMRVVQAVNEDPFIERIGKLNKQNKISKVFHCGGLLLCDLREDKTRVIVCNPYWGQTRSIELSRYSYFTWRFDTFRHALGYEDKGSYRSYKLLIRFTDQYYYTPTNECSLYRIYDFDSSLWKTLDITTLWSIRYHHHGVSVKGNTYWPASLINSPTEDYIISFDFTSESFGPLLRLPFDPMYSENVTLSCVREEKLAVLFRNAEVGEFEIWISTKIEAKEVLWSKFLSVEMETGSFSLTRNNSFFIDEEKKVAMGNCKTFKIVGEAGYLKKMELVERAGRDGNLYMENACSYVPSLVQIKQPASGRKR